MKSKARYQKVYVKMWNGESFRALSDRARLLWLYLLTSPETTMVPGIVPSSLLTIAARVRWTEPDTAAAMAELEEAGMAVYDPAGLVWLPEGIEHNPPDAPTNVLAWAGVWGDMVPTCPLKAVAYDGLRARMVERGPRFVEAFDSACKRPTFSGKNRVGQSVSATPPPSPHPTPTPPPHPSPRTQQQYQEQKQEQNTPPPPLGGKAREGAPVGVRGDSNPPDLPTAPEPPPSAKTAPCALPDEADDPTGPLTSRGVFLPPLRATAPDPQPAPSPAPEATTSTTPEPPVVVVAPEPCPAPPTAPASHETAPVAPVTPRPPSAPAEAPSGQLALVADAAKAPVATTRKRRKAAPVADEADVVSVFEFWRETVWKSRAILNEERRNRIAARLAEGFSVEDMRQAARGVLRDDNLMGRREGARQGGWRDIETVFRDAAQVERLMQLAPRAPVTPPPPTPPTDERPADSATRRMVAAYLAGTYEPPAYPVPRPASPYLPPVAAHIATHGAAHV